MYAALLVTLFVLGCTSGGSTGSVDFSQTSGAVINDFTFDVTRVEDLNDQAVLTFSYQNVGGKTMLGATKAFVYGPVMSMAGANAKPTKVWQASQITGGGNLESGTNRIEWSVSDAKFFPPDPQTGQPGMSQVDRVVFIPPNQDEGMNDIPYTFEGRLCYPYKTTSSSIIRAVALNSFAPVAAKKTLAETRDSAGPIQISLKAGENIRASVSGGKVSLPLVFEVRDLGGGFATLDTVACDPLVGRSDIGVLTATVFIDGTKANCPSNIYIRNGVGNLFCTGEFQTQNPKTEYHIVANVKYNYYVTKSATVTVSDSKDTADIDTA